MPYGKFIYIICLFSVFSVIGFGCAQNYDYDEVKDKVNTNKAEFDKLAKDFLSQNVCAAFLRRDLSKEKSFIPYSGGRNLVYWVVPLADLKPYEIVIPKEYDGKEEKFWERDYKDIKGSNDDLETFLNKYGIQKEFFKGYKDFIRRNELYGFERSKDFNYLIIRFGSKDGLIYQPESGSEPKHSSSTEIKKIDENWYYFSE